MISTLLGVAFIIKSARDEDELWAYIGAALIAFGMIRMIFFRDLGHQVLERLFG